MALSCETVERVFTYVQHFIRDTIFTQKSYFSDCGVAMVREAVAVADSVIVSEELNPWSVFGDVCNHQVASDLQSCLKKVVIRRKTSRDTSERWFGSQCAGSASTKASVGRSGVRILNVVEERRLEYVVVAEPTADLSHSAKSPVIGRKRKASLSSGPKSRNCSEVVNPVSYPRKSDGAVLDREASGSRRRCGRDRRAAPLFQFGKKK